jgi:hypothetical protein
MGEGGKVTKFDSIYTSHTRKLKTAEMKYPEASIYHDTPFHLSFIWCTTSSPDTESSDRISSPYIVGS